MWAWELNICLPFLDTYMRIIRTITFFALKTRSRLSFCFSGIRSKGILVYPNPLSVTLKLEEANEGWKNKTESASVTEEAGEKYSQVSAAVSKTKAKLLLPFQNLEGSKCVKLLLGKSLVSLSNSESSVCKGGSFCPLRSRVLQSSCVPLLTLLAWE